jgi:uroporphyrin-III C-methyltransferase/precorrin-2 dehydrogenase/sirohydrochlorin ferrochelatase
MRFFPVFLDLAARTVVLVGCGDPAENKLRLLRAARARVRWHVDDPAAVERAHADDQVEVRALHPDPDLAGATAVIAASGGDADVRIAARARALNIPVNVVDRPDLSTFIVPAIVDRGDVVVAIGTGGAAPVLARRLRERIEAMLPARIGGLAALMGRYRQRLAAHSHGLARRFWEQVVDGPVAASVLAGRPLEAEAELARMLDRSGREPKPAGTVYLVGAGPGDADLLTLRALQVLQSADVVFYDETVSREVLDRARRDAARVLVGSRRGAAGIGPAGMNHREPSDREIDRRLVQAARAGRQVVRLAGAAPGRGDEELAHLRQAGVQVVVVPGIAAAPATVLPLIEEAA